MQYENLKEYIVRPLTDENSIVVVYIDKAKHIGLIFSYLYCEENIIMDLPQVSILIPTYNQPELLKRALDSVLIQTFRDFEVVITDDSDNDEVLKVIREYSDLLEIKYFKNTVRLGSTYNWNEAIQKSSGKYIKFLHHDDWFYDENGLNYFVDALDSNPDSDIAFCDSNVYDVHQTLINVHTLNQYDIANLNKSPKYLFANNIMGSPSAIIYRRSVDKKFDLKLKWVVDIDFYYSILIVNPKFIYIPKNAICTSHGLPGQITLSCQNNKKIELFEWIYLYKKMNNRSINIRSLIFIWNLLYKFSIVNAQEIIDLGIKPVPKLICYLIYGRYIQSRILKFRSKK